MNIKFLSWINRPDTDISCAVNLESGTTSLYDSEVVSTVKTEVGVGVTDMIDVAVYLHRVCPNTTSDVKFLSW